MYVYLWPGWWDALIGAKRPQRIRGTPETKEYGQKEREREKEVAVMGVCMCL